MGTSNTWGFSSPPRTIGSMLLKVILSTSVLHSILHVETLLEALMLAADLECHTAQSVSRLRLGGAHLPNPLERKAFNGGCRHSL